MRFGVIVFPGSNCDRDCADSLAHVLQEDVRLIWHQETSLAGVDAVVLPGGFSYGDYLRSGAIAQFSPIMGPLRQFAAQGGMVMGICNGFQILLEMGLLPGVMLRNQGLSFLCEDVYVKVENASTPFTGRCFSGQILRIPIAHGEGNYYTDPVTLSSLQANAQIVFRYCSSKGESLPSSNPNGSLDHIAGIRNAAGNILGLMPHPERCAEHMLGNEDGRLLFLSMLDALTQAQTSLPVTTS
jgi:phosphoribosylformylglycinamidine synthase